MYTTDLLISLVSLSLSLEKESRFQKLNEPMNIVQWIFKKCNYQTCVRRMCQKSKGYLWHSRRAESEVERYTATHSVIHIVSFYSSASSLVSFTRLFFFSILPLLLCQCMYGIFFLFLSFLSDSLSRSLDCISESSFFPSILCVWVFLPFLLLSSSSSSSYSFPYSFPLYFSLSLSLSLSLSSFPSSRYSMCKSPSCLSLFLLDLLQSFSLFHGTFSHPKPNACQLWLQLLKDTSGQSKIETVCHYISSIDWTFDL